MARRKAAKKRVAEPRAAQPESPVVEPVEKPAPKPAARENYGSFYEAWVQVKELRQYTQRNGQPRIGLDSDGLAKAKALISEYTNG